MGLCICSCRRGNGFEFNLVRDWYKGCEACRHYQAPTKRRHAHFQDWFVCIFTRYPCGHHRLEYSWQPHRFRLNDAFIFASIPIIIFYFGLWYRAKGFDKARLGTLFTIFGVAIIFWNIYNQNSTALTIWADTYTNRETPPAVENF